MFPVGICTQQPSAAEANLERPRGQRRRESKDAGGLPPSNLPPFQNPAFASVACCWDFTSLVRVLGFQQWLNEARRLKGVVLPHASIPAHVCTLRSGTDPPTPTSCVSGPIVAKQCYISSTSMSRCPVSSRRLRQPGPLVSTSYARRLLPVLIRIKWDGRRTPRHNRVWWTRTRSGPEGGCPPRPSGRPRTVVCGPLDERSHAGDCATHGPVSLTCRRAPRYVVPREECSKICAAGTLRDSGERTVRKPR